MEEVDYTNSILLSAGHTKNFFFGGGGGGWGVEGARVSVFLCPRDDSQGALRFAPVCPSVCLSVRSSRFTV